MHGPGEEANLLHFAESNTATQGFILLERSQNGPVLVNLIYQFNVHLFYINSLFPLRKKSLAESYLMIPAYPKCVAINESEVCTWLGSGGGDRNDSKLPTSSIS